MPTIKNISGPYRLFFYSFDCSEPRHVHVQRERHLCEFWLEPLTLATNDGFTARVLNRIRILVQSLLERILEARNEHCGQH